MPGGKIICRRSRIFNKSSGNPSGIGKLISGGENGAVNPGMDNAGGPFGSVIVRSLGLQGMLFIYQYYSFSPGSFGSKAPTLPETPNDDSTSVRSTVANLEIVSSTFDASTCLES